MPSTRDVLRFYSQYWRINQTDSKKESLVANALEEFYKKRNVRTISKPIIRRKIRKEIGNLKNILRFKSKNKTNKQIQIEDDFKSRLSNVFRIEKSCNDDLSFETPMDFETDTDSGKKIIETKFVTK